MSGIRLSMKIWDIPTRLFHWLIVILIATSYITIQFDQLRLHFLSGYAILTLLLFRIVWGFVGSDTSRFGQFLRSPIEGLRHLAQFTRRDPDTEIGHNAAGGWMVLVMLVLLGVQVGTGLFSNDDSFTEAPLAHNVSKATSDQLTKIHGFNFNLLLGLIVLHICAIIAYALVKRHYLVGAMISGRKRLPGNMRAPRMANPVLAGLVMLMSAATVWALVRYA